MANKESKMANNENIRPPQDIPLNTEELQNAILETEKQEQLYSIALFDILGFSNLVQNSGTQIVLDLYNKLVGLIHDVESDYNNGRPFSGSVVPVPFSSDWKNSQMVASANGYIHVCHFSDTFLIYVNYIMGLRPWLLRDTYYEPYPLLLGERGTGLYPIFVEKHHIYLSFLQICMEFFCEAISAGIPLRGCISTGLATMDQHRSVYFGRPLVEAARGEPAQNCIGISFGRSFNNYHPVYNRYFIPYLGNHKDNDKRTEFLSPMALDWPRFWRGHPKFSGLSIEDPIQKMNKHPSFSPYYEGAIRFAGFSKQHENWPEEINRDGLTDILDYYSQVETWYEKRIQ